jgi:hypothetical protein
MPIKIDGPVFDGVVNVPEFVFVLAAIDEPMNAEYPQMIFGTEDPDL